MFGMSFFSYIMNDLTWCGCKGGVNCIDGINYNACTCCDQVKDYWANASKIVRIVSILCNNDNSHSYNCFGHFNSHRHSLTVLDISIKFLLTIF